MSTKDASISLQLRNSVTFVDNRTGKSVEMPILEGSQGPPVIDIAKLHSATGLFTFDPGFGSTSSCKSAITFIDGNTGVLQYRGYDIQWLVDHCDHMDVCYLLFYGELPLRAQRKEFVANIRQRSLLNENMRRVLAGFRQDSHPMAIMVGAVGALSAYYEVKDDTPARRELIAHRMIAKIPTVAAWAYRFCRGEQFVYPRDDLGYAANFLHMLFATPETPYIVDPIHAKALDLMLMVHADHEQTAETTCVRTAGSSNANPFACIASGIASLWGPTNRANEAVIQMLEQIATVDNIPLFVAKAKDHNDPFRLMGFGHRVYKTYDPRAKILQQLCQKLVQHTGQKDPLLHLALELEKVVLHDEYFISRKLYPNVDFYSGLVFRTLGVPTEMFTVIFAVARAAGWIAQWKEMVDDPKRRIVRPRQLYVGYKARNHPSKL